MDLGKARAYPAASYSASATHDVATVTFPHPTNSQFGIFITKFVISVSAAPTAAVEATLTGPVDIDGEVTLKIEIPAASSAPLVFNFEEHPLICAPATNATLALPDLGAGKIGTVLLFGYVGTTSAISAVDHWVVTASDYAPVAGTDVTISAQAYDALGAFVPGVRTVTWSSTGSGTLASPTTTTDSSGLATNTLHTSALDGDVETVSALGGGVSGTSSAITTQGGGGFTHFDPAHFTSPHFSAAHFT